MKLRLTHPAVGPLVFEVPPEGVVLGRAHGPAKIELNWDLLVSRRHARIWLEQGEVWFEDLGSRNGSWLGGDRLQGAVRLSLTTRLQVGDSVLTLADPAEPIDQLLGQPRGFELIDSPITYAGIQVRRADDEPVSTVDLRDPPHPPSGAVEPATPAGRQARVHPRLIAPGQVRVQLKDRNELRPLWLDNISKGGLFAGTDDPPAWGTRVEVILDHGQGDQLALHAQVVHVVESQGGKELDPGVGMQFVDLSPEKKAQIQRFVDGLSERLSDLPGASSAERDQAVQAAHRFLAAFEANDLYEALEVTPTASIEQLALRVLELKRVFHDRGRDAPPAQSARLASARRCLEKVAALMADPVRRLDYDFRNGQVRAKQRLAAARTPGALPVSRLWEVWARVFPGHIERAAQLSRAAFEHRARREFAAGVASGRAALELNPFIEELWSTVEAWEQLSDQP